MPPARALPPLALAALLALGACGFALRGADAVSSNFSELRLDLQQPDGELARLLRRRLEAAGVDAEAAGPGAPVLSVGAERTSGRPVTVTPRARAAQIEIRLAVDISLTRRGETLIPLQTLALERSYYESIENITGNREEAEIITDELRRDLADRIMRRLQAAGER